MPESDLFKTIRQRSDENEDSPLPCDVVERPPRVPSRLSSSVPSSVPRRVSSSAPGSVQSSVPSSFVKQCAE